jgi:hypothetical protein
MATKKISDTQLAKALNGLMKEVSLEIGEMLGACLRELKKNPLATRAQCQKMERCIEGHRETAKSEKRQFAAATADGLLEAVNRLRASLRPRRARQGRK